MVYDRTILTKNSLKITYYAAFYIDDDFI